jgi:hypothetical protein
MHVLKKARYPPFLHYQLSQMTSASSHNHVNADPYSTKKFWVSDGLATSYSVALLRGITRFQIEELVTLNLAESCLAFLPR